jgi:hypothetical protein
MCASATTSDLKLPALFVSPLCGKRKVIMRNWLKAVFGVTGFIAVIVGLMFLIHLWAWSALIYLGVALAFMVHEVKGSLDSYDELKRIKSR